MSILVHYVRTFWFWLVALYTFYNAGISDDVIEIICSTSIPICSIILLYKNNKCSLNEIWQGWEAGGKLIIDIQIV